MGDEFLTKLLRSIHEIDQCIAGIRSLGKMCIDDESSEDFQGMYRLKNRTALLKEELEHLIKHYWTKNAVKKRKPNTNL